MTVLENARSAIGYALALTSLIVLGFLLVVFYSEVLLIVFLSILLAIFFRSISNPIRDYLHLPDTLSVLLSIAILVIGFGIIFYFALPQIFIQLNALVNQLPAAWNQVSAYLQKYDLLSRYFESGQVIAYAQTALLRAGTLFSNVLGVSFSIFLVSFLSIFFAINPQSYLKRVFQLVPKKHLNTAHDLFEKLHKILRKWILGVLGSIASIGLLTYVGLSFLGVESALVLSLIAAMFSVIPNFGPLLGLIPAALIALTQGPWVMGYVIILYVIIQTLESNLITPTIQQRSTAQPPGLILFWQILMSAFAGLLGLVLAAPFLCVLSVTLDVLYVRGILGKKDV